MAKLRENKNKRVYKIVLGFFFLEEKKYYEETNGTSINVLALNVWEALAIASNWILDEEKKAKKENEGVFVSEVLMGDSVDLITKEDITDLILKK